jgi:hypothetical protein
VLDDGGTTVDEAEGARGAAASSSAGVIGGVGSPVVGADLGSGGISPAVVPKSSPDSAGSTVTSSPEGGDASSPDGSGSTISLSESGSGTGDGAVASAVTASRVAPVFD